jgi:peptidoglycan/LPS O-acetylase OafA/YrhL
MVAVLMVFANHLWDLPTGGFVGVDVFFVISGFLITGNLVRMAETAGNVSFKNFYWNRVRRIVPAATVVLLLTYAGSTLVFLPFRSHQVGIDALFALVFASNWWFAYENTDYFRAAASTVSPVQHYWSLSIEEQFYFVWPALIFVISVLIVRKKWSHSRRMAIAGGVMTAIVAASLSWALHETVTSSTAAYFNTFARVWELGVGALLATAVGLLARIPAKLKPVLSWAGLLLIAASLFLISDNSAGFPAPWAALPVGGAALVIAAGVGAEPRFQGFLRNPTSTYIGDISYSLYLIHWPVIVLLGALMDVSVHFYVTVLALSFALAIASYHMIENPLRRADTDKLRDLSRRIRNRRYWPKKSSQYALLGAMTLLVVAAIACVSRPVAIDEAAPPSLAAEGSNSADADAPSGPAPKFGPLTTALQTEILAALRTAAWPSLNPSMESVLESKKIVSPEVETCYPSEVAHPDLCNYGSPSAPIRIVIVGDSVATGYAEIFREMALNSNGQLQVLNQTMPSCVFTQDPIDREDVSPQCGGRKDSAVDVINTVKPNAVIISNSYEGDHFVGNPNDMSMPDWSDSLRRIVDRFRGSTQQVVLLAPPPSDKSIRDCVSKRSSTPASCVGSIPDRWKSMAGAEQKLSKSIGGVWIDSRPWFCNPSGHCPSFVGSTPARADEIHMAPPYASKIRPVVAESLRDAGIPIPADG